MKVCHALPIARPVGLAKSSAMDNLKQGPRLPSQDGVHAPAGGEREEPSDFGLSAFCLHRVKVRLTPPWEDEV